MVAFYLREICFKDEQKKYWKAWNNIFLFEELKYNALRSYQTSNIGTWGCVALNQACDYNQELGYPIYFCDLLFQGRHKFQSNDIASCPDVPRQWL